MRRLCGSITFLALLATAMNGCGSTSSGNGDDATILRFMGFETGSTSQADSVRASSADVDVVQDTCVMTGMTGQQNMTSPELFTQTVADAIFINEQKLDIEITNYTIHIDDPDVGVGDQSYGISGTVTGGRCSDASAGACASDQDCFSGGTTGTCVFADSSIGGIVLVDFDTKEHISPLVYGRALPVVITFHGRDIVGNSYTVKSNYTMTFADFCNCQMGQACE